jgi:tRNA pseudouridine55 synthase
MSDDVKSGVVSLSYIRPCRDDVNPAVSQESPFGFLNIDKPLGMTSHDVVARARRVFGVRKVGHAGTLDPLATGVLVICLGGATRLSEYVMHAQKRYTARVHFGITTTTYDAEGEITETRDASHLTAQHVLAHLPTFTGEFMQTPPIYSAIKLDGRKLYDIARSGGTVELQPRVVRIDSITLLDWRASIATLDVSCSSGTYIRSLAYDLGMALGVGAHLAGLMRTQSGSFRIEDAVAPDAAFADHNWRSRIISPDRALQGWRRIVLDTAQADIVAHGGSVTDEGVPEGTLSLAYKEDDALLAVVRSESGMAVPQKVFWKG